MDFEIVGEIARIETIVTGQLSTVSCLMNLSHLHVSLAVALITLLCAPAVAAESVFPMETGSYWLYEGKTGWSQSGSAVAEEKILQWRSEVIGRADSPGLRVAILQGFPSDLAWYQPGKKPGVYALVETSDLAYYLLEDGRAEKSRANGQVAASDLSPEQLLFRWPMTPGDRFGDPSSVDRTDGTYAWVVEDRSPADLKAIRGVRQGMLSALRYRLALRTNPDHTFLELVPGIGIIHYTYGHHGTPAYTDLKLVEFGNRGTRANKSREQMPAKSGGRRSALGR